MGMGILLSKQCMPIALGLSWHVPGNVEQKVISLPNLVGIELASRFATLDLGIEHQSLFASGYINENA